MLSWKGLNSNIVQYRKFLANGEKVIIIAQKKPSQ